MSELQKRLRDWNESDADRYPSFYQLEIEAADALDAQAQEIARLKEWRDKAVANCARRQCYSRDQRQRECEAECDALRARLKTIEAQASDATEYVLAQINQDLRARVEAAEKDAERYRWLRRPTTLGVGMVMIWQRGKGRYDYATGDDLDAAVDAARSGT